MDAILQPKITKPAGVAGLGFTGLGWFMNYMGFPVHPFFAYAFGFVCFCLVTIGLAGLFKAIVEHIPRVRFVWPGEMDAGGGGVAAEGASVSGPNQPLKWAVDYINGVRGDAASTEPSSWSEIRQAARLGQIVVYGRPNASNYKPREPIPKDHWRDYGLDFLACEHDPDPQACGTEPDNPRIHMPGDRYLDLQVDENEIRRCWPLSATGNVPRDSPQSRSDLIATARRRVAAILKETRNGEAFLKALESEEIFMQLRPFFGRTYLGTLRSRGRIVRAPNSGSTIPNEANDFLNEVERIEAEWGLR